MKLVTVIPISKGVFKDRLTYFTSKEISKGSVVSILVRKKEILSLVVDIKDIDSSKTSIKKLDYELKKISSVKNDSVFSTDFIKAIEKTAEHFLCNEGQVIEFFVPKTILENVNKLKTKQEHKKNLPRKENFQIEKLLVQNLRTERMDYYKGLARESFASNKSIFICLPTIISVEKAYADLEKGISDYSIKLHSDLKKEELIRLWTKAVESKHPLLIISTPQFLSIQRNDLGTIILDEENSRSYKQITRPFLDTRFFIEKLAEQIGARFILGDIILRTETIKRLEDKEFNESPSMKKRLFFSAESFIIENKKIDDGKKLPTLSSEMEEFLVFTRKQQEKTFLLCGRKGLYPNTICGDCGKLVTCKNCGNHLSLSLAKNGSRNFVCYKCNKKYEVINKCLNCESWRLITLGSGIENIRKEIEELVGKDNIFQVDAETTKTSKQTEKEIRLFMESKNGVLIGTEKVLNYLNEAIENTGALFVDSWLCVPDFSIKEKIMKNILLLQSFSRKRFLIQTRSPEESVFSYGIKGLVSEFSKEELELRERLNYPPYCQLIKIRTAQKLSGELEKLHERLIKINPRGEYFYLKDGNNKTSILILKLSKKEPMKELIRNEIISLPPSFVINVDPENIL